MTFDDTTESPRPGAGFRAYVITDDSAEGEFKPVDITYALQDLYDIAVNSMDFGSGFLSTEEVGNLRKIGEAIGAKRFDYQHDKCLVCGVSFQHHYGQQHEFVRS